MPKEKTVESGNINLQNRPRVKNPDGSISTVRSIGVNIDGQEVLLPTISDDGRIMSPDEAIAQYRATGKHLGKFGSQAESDAYGQSLHKEQEKMISTPPEIPEEGDYVERGIRKINNRAVEFGFGPLTITEIAAILQKAKPPTPINGAKPKEQPAMPGAMSPSMGVMGAGQ